MKVDDWLVRNVNATSFYPTYVEWLKDAEVLDDYQCLSAASSSCGDNDCSSFSEALPRVHSPYSDWLANDFPSGQKESTQDGTVLGKMGDLTISGTSDLLKDWLKK